ncbi:hypothetical protein BUALT_Bualt07G0060400 [Buddleja alternifolia]|uniref:Uncharacterized protein n=1 Tax=Buddleja alternifolia TaxID=168488 RepID=A0AAV6XJG0_9LAMI|nr:hypothetical protein BUALT_Bualt07G0060400 [Buddleja alternifolia]
MAKGFIKNCWWWTRPVKITVIWLICAASFYSFFHMALRNSPRPTISEGSSISNAEKRSILYTKMEKDLDENGAVFLKQGETSQSLSLSDLFTLKDGTVTPVLRAANPPIRANVLHLSSEYSVPISTKVLIEIPSWALHFFPLAEAVKNILLPYFDKAIWFQNSSIYHFSMFHASHHISPVPATEAEVEAEASAVKASAESMCPLSIALDRVVLTSTGVLLGCWQVVSGTDPVTIRAKLKTALPRAPQKQLYDDTMLHTSFARLLGPPKKFSEEENKFSGLQIFHELVNRVNNQIRGLKAMVSELWYVEEYDLLALALNGKMKIRKFQMRCSKP